MALSIRLSRGGRKKRPFYRIVVADKRMPRDGRYIERLGTYNPLLNDDNEQRVTLVKERIEYWLSKGAKPSERVAIFLGKAGMIDMPEHPVRPTKSAQSEKTKMKIADKQEKVKAAKEAAEAAEAEAKAAAEAAANAPTEEAPAATVEAAPAEEPKAEEAAEKPQAEEEKKDA
ncbi:MAG: 30S ribosomal protein S16 [Alphaproteobacteria bacterium]|nr:30S ribosomal protein S16 [Alphaproteobacteria bacterium]